MLELFPFRLAELQESDLAIAAGNRLQNLAKQSGHPDNISFFNTGDEMVLAQWRGEYDIGKLAFTDLIPGTTVGLRTTVYPFEQYGEKVKIAPPYNWPTNPYFLTYEKPLIIQHAEKIMAEEAERISPSRHEEIDPEFLRQFRERIRNTKPITNLRIPMDRSALLHLIVKLDSIDPAKHLVPSPY